MKLLICTQKIDMNDTVLGFFHTWVREISKRCESVTVIALGVGRNDLPKNVHVLSLGKEEKTHSRFKYVLRFYWYVWRERKNYDKVFVHMNDEYVVLGGWLWNIIGKRIYHWRNHPKGGWMIDVAMRFSTRVYATSPFAYVALKYPNRVTLMPAGIDTELFHADSTVIPTPHSILFFGRLSPVKKVDLFLRALVELKKESYPFVVHIVGDPHNPEDDEYRDLLVKFIKANNLSDSVTISGGIPNIEAPSLYHHHEIYVNLTTTGSFDKTIFEAMSSGLLLATTNRALKSEISDVFLAKEDDAEDLARCLRTLLHLRHEEKESYQKALIGYVEQKHSLKELMKRLFVEVEKISIINQ